MKEFIYLGKVVNTHGIKGEIRIKSDFLKKDLVFKKDFKLYFGSEKSKENIATYRKHKDYDMVTLENINNINDVLKYKGKKVYIKREDLKLNEKDYLLEDLIGLKVIENEKMLGIIKDFMYNSKNILLMVSGKKNFYIPYNKFFIKNVDLEKQEVYVENAKDLIL